MTATSCGASIRPVDTLKERKKGTGAMTTRLKPGKKLERFVPSKSHDARIKFKSGELCVGLEVTPDGTAIQTFRVKGTKTTFSAPVDSLYRQTVIWNASAARLKKANEKNAKRAAAKEEARIRRMLRRGGKKQ